MAEDNKSKMPDMKEIGAMASKLYKDVKESICEIISDYKSKHPTPPPEEKKTEDKAAESDEKPKKSAKNKEGEE